MEKARRGPEQRRRLEDLWASFWRRSQMRFGCGYFRDNVLEELEWNCFHSFFDGIRIPSFN